MTSDKGQTMHTPEPLEYFDGGLNGFAIIHQGADTNRLAQVFYKPMQNGKCEGYEEAEQFARRIVACVNYCEGVPTEMLEPHRGELTTITQQALALGDERDRLAARNAELTKALERTLAMTTDIMERDLKMTKDMVADHSVIHLARAVLALAREEKS